MRRRWFHAIVLGGVGASLAMPAGPAGAQCRFSTFLQIDVPGVTTFYYDDRSSIPPVPGVVAPDSDGTWIYEESNTVGSLQRGGAQWLLDMVGLGDLDREICIESSSPDKLWL